MGSITSRLRHHSWVASYLALFLALGLGSAWAATALDKNEVKSKHIKNGGIKTKDLANDAVTSPKVANGSLLSEDFADGQLPRGPQGEQGIQGLQGVQGERGPSGATNVVVRSANNPAGSGTASVTCNAGEKAVGGGYELGSGIRAIASQPTSSTGTAQNGQTPIGWTVLGVVDSHGTIPPAAFVRMSVRTPSAAITRTGSATVSAVCPS